MNCVKPCNTNPCPKVPKHGCACCPFRKVVIPTALGDDSEGSDYAPENGAYQNALVEYEANGAMYIYASDGIYTKVSMVAGGHGAASVTYVDNQDAATLAAAKDYTDSVIPELDVTKTYVDDQDAATLVNAKDYTDDVAYLTMGNQMTIASPAGGTSVSVTFNTNTDSITVSNNNGDSVTTPTKTSDITNDGSDGNSTYVEADELATVATSGSYNDLLNKPNIPEGVIVDDALSGTSEHPVQNKVINSALNTKADTADLAAVAFSGTYIDLDNKPTIPTIIMQTTDPGEGSTLADNTFIGVYS